MFKQIFGGIPTVEPLLFSIDTESTATLATKTTEEEFFLEDMNTYMIRR